MKLILSDPRGFCGGVRRALEIVERELVQSGKPLYILHELVHNESVVNELKTKGAIIVEEAEEAPAGSTLIFSAHGVSEETERRARALPLHVVDATCPLVRQTQEIASEWSKKGYFVILFGKNGHREVEGILGRIPGEKLLIETEAEAEAYEPDARKRYVCISQTTLNAKTVDSLFDILRKKHQDIQLVRSVCQATRERQESVRALAKQCGAVLIVGSRRSSNTMRLAEVAREAGTHAYLVSAPDAVTPDMLRDINVLGITSGASAPDALIDEVASAVRRMIP